MPTPELSRDDLLDALRELAAIMQLRGQHGRVYVVGGAAMMLAHSANRTTRDIDAAFEEGYSAIIDAARDVGERRGWPRSWLNEGATVYMPRRDQRHGSIIFDHPDAATGASVAQLPEPRPTSVTHLPEPTRQASPGTTHARSRPHIRKSIRRSPLAR